MEFTLENHTHYAIQAYTDEAITVAINEEFTQAASTLMVKNINQPFILSIDTLMEDWQPAEIPIASPIDFQALLDYAPEVVILGTGQRVTFPPADALQAFYQRNIGVEIMDTGAACRTFNVLASENRKVIAGFMQI